MSKKPFGRSPGRTVPAAPDGAGTGPPLPEGRSGRKMTRRQFLARGQERW